jgi:small-conductance mechanosensitive channel
VSRVVYELSFLAAAILLGALSFLPALARFRPHLRWSGLLLLVCAGMLLGGEGFAALDRALPGEPPALRTALRVAFWVAGALFGTALLRSVLRHWISPKSSQPRARKLFADLLVGLVYLVAGVGILDAVFGPSLTGLLATSGVVAIVVGLALQNTLADLFSGLALSIERPFRAGDWIVMQGAPEGQILEINWRATRLRTRAGDLLVVPNSVLAKSVVTNHDRLLRTHAVGVGVTFGHDIDPDLATELLIAAGRKLPLALSHPAPSASLLSCGPLGIAYELDFYVANYADAPEAANQALRAIWREARQRDVAFAAPREEILLERQSEPVTAAPPRPRPSPHKHPVRHATSAAADEA